MEELFSLLKSLSPAEWKSFRQYLTCFTAHDVSGLKFLQLAELLMEAETCPSEECCRMKTNYSKHETCFDALKSRLKEKVLDFLLTDISCDKKQELDEADYAIVKMKKKSAQFQQLFFSKKRIPLLYGMLDEIILLAKEYEQYSMLVEHLRYKKTIVGMNKGKEEFEKINKEMEKYWECNRMVNKAEHYYHELMMLSEYCGKPNEKKLSAFFEKAITELDGYYEQTKSPLIKYHQTFLELGFYQHRKNYSKAQSVCMELLDVVRNNKSVYRRQRIGVVYDNLSRCKVYLGQFEHAAEYARDAQKHFNAGSENFCIALEQEFYALFAMGKNYEAIDIANKMISFATRKELGEFRYSKYNYLLANALFKERKFEGALHLLSQEREIAKDKAGWETGARILTIMTQIEMLKMDEASLAVSNLKRFFTRTNIETPICPRDKKILNLLLLAERKGFVFTMLNGNTDKYFSALTSGEETLRWEPFTHEVIPFHEWFAEKMKGKTKFLPRNNQDTMRKKEFIGKYKREKSRT